MNDDYAIDPTPVGSTAPTPVASTAPAPAPVTGVRAGTATMARIGLLGIGAAALVAVAVLVFGATAAPGGTLAGSEDTSGTGAAEELGGFRGGPGFGHKLGGITITAISGSNISLETVDGWTRTITVDADTTYSKSGDEIALGDLAVGDEIAFRQTLEDDGTWSIDAIAVIPPHVGGEVTAVDGSTITVEQRDGTTATITVTDTTQYQVDGDVATLADVEVGMRLLAEGTENADGSLTATDVRAADLDDIRGPDGRGGRGFFFGPGFDWPKDGDPDATEAPSATGSAS